MDIIRTTKYDECLKSGRGSVPRYLGFTYNSNKKKVEYPRLSLCYET